MIDHDREVVGGVNRKANKFNWLLLYKGIHNTPICLKKIGDRDNLEFKFKDLHNALA
jgi:hypothetical protein